MPDRDNAEPGEILGDVGHARADANLIAYAMRRRWPVPDKVREALMNKLATIALQNHSDPRINVNAGKAIIQAERQNQVDDLWALNTGGQDPTAHGAAPAAPDAIASAMDASVPDVAAG